MNSVPGANNESEGLQKRVTRDTAAAAAIPKAAEERRRSQLMFKPGTSMTGGVSQAEKRVAQGLELERQAVQKIASHPFHAMVEGFTKNAGSLEKRVLWYAHEKTSCNVVLELNGQQYPVMAWTHAGVQCALTGDLGEWDDIERSGYAIRAVKPTARAWFTRVTPALAGVYEPGGVLDTPVVEEQKPGLKAVKLQMTPDQVKAFVARPSGYMVVTGAPGTGKTTVTFQRIRFLFDQQTEFSGSLKVPYRPSLTRIFLASRNLIGYSRQLLKEELEIPGDVVSHVPEFIQRYLTDTWRVTGRARPIARQMDRITERAREAMLNLCGVRDLEGVWSAFETQVRTRLPLSDDVEWRRIAARAGGETARLAEALAEELARVPKRLGTDVLDSPVRMDALWRRVQKPYADCRRSMIGDQRERFDDAFVSWLYEVYDPLAALREWFRTQDEESVRRIKDGTGEGQTTAFKIFSEVIDDWSRRLYGTAELSWIAWLLRFALPEDAAVEDGFRAVPRALPEPDDQEQRRWTHVVIDEAQDLSVQEASLLASFVHPSGALTVSADFNQVVSPVHGMANAAALSFGLPIRDRNAHIQFPFRRNMRQAREIGLFLQSFHKSAFGQIAPFDAGDRRERHKPQVLIGPRAQFAQRVKQLTNVLKKKGTTGSVAVILVHDDQDALLSMRSSLQILGVEVAEPDNLLDRGRVVVTTVEQAKGLEFDMCVIIGLDDVERFSVNFAKNRSYVALSRPTRKLIMLCERPPEILHDVPRDLYDRFSFARP